MDRLEKYRNEVMTLEEKLYKELNKLESLDNCFNNKDELLTIENNIKSIFIEESKLKYNVIQREFVPIGVATKEDKDLEIKDKNESKVFSIKSFIILNIVCWILLFCLFFVVNSSIEYKHDNEKIFTEFKDESLKIIDQKYNDGYLQGVREDSAHWKGILDYILNNIEIAYELNNDIGNEYLLLTLDDKVKDYTLREYSDKLNESLEKLKLDEKSKDKSKNLNIDETVDINAFITNTGNYDIDAYLECIVNNSGLVRDSDKELLYNYVSGVTVSLLNTDKFLEWITLKDSDKILDAFGDQKYLNYANSVLNGEN